MIKDNDQVRMKPILLTTFVLQIPNIVIVPPIEELQHCFGKLVSGVLEIYKHVTAWGQRYYNLKSENIPANAQGSSFVGKNENSKFYKLLNFCNRVQRALMIFSLIQKIMQFIGRIIIT